MDHDLDLNLNTFKSYLYRFRSQDRDTQEKPAFDKPKKEISSSFLSSFQDTEKKENESDQKTSQSQSTIRQHTLI